MTDTVYGANTGDNNYEFSAEMASGDTITFPIGNLDRISIQADNTAGSVAFSVSNDGTNFVSAGGYAPADPTTIAATAFANGMKVFLCDATWGKITASVGTVNVTVCGRRIGVFAQ